MDMPVGFSGMLMKPILPSNAGFWPMTVRALYGVVVIIAISSSAISRSRSAYW